MRRPRHIVDNVLDRIRDFERACSCEECALGRSCVDCPHCVEQMTTQIGAILGLGQQSQVTQIPLFRANVLEFRPREKKPCQGEPAEGKRNA